MEMYDLFVQTGDKFAHKLPYPNMSHVEEVNFFCGKLYGGGTLIMGKGRMEYAKKRYGVLPCRECFGLAKIRGIKLRIIKLLDNLRFKVEAF